MEEFEANVNVKISGMKPTGVSMNDFLSQYIIVFQDVNKKSSTHWPYGTKNPNEPTISIKEVSIVKPQ